MIGNRLLFWAVPLCAGLLGLDTCAFARPEIAEPARVPMHAHRIEAAYERAAKELLYYYAGMPTYSDEVRLPAKRWPLIKLVLGSESTVKKETRETLLTLAILVDDAREIRKWAIARVGNLGADGLAFLPKLYDVALGEELAPLRVTAVKSIHRLIQYARGDERSALHHFVETTEEAAESPLASDRMVRAWHALARESEIPFVQLLALRSLAEFHHLTNRETEQLKGFARAFDRGYSAIALLSLAHTSSLDPAVAALMRELTYSPQIAPESRIVLTEYLFGNREGDIGGLATIVAALAYEGKQMDPKAAVTIADEARRVARARPDDARAILQQLSADREIAVSPLFLQIEKELAGDPCVVAVKKPPQRLKLRLVHHFWAPPSKTRSGEPSAAPAPEAGPPIAPALADLAESP